MKKSYFCSTSLHGICAASAIVGVLFAAPGAAQAQEIVVNRGESRVVTKQSKPIDGVIVKGGTLTASDVEIKRTGEKAVAATIEEGGRLDLARTKVNSEAAALAALFNTSGQATFAIGDKSQVDGSKAGLLNVTRGAQGGDGTADIVIAGGATAKGDIVDSGRKTPGGYTDVRVDQARFDGGVTGVRSLTLMNGGIWGVGTKTDTGGLALGSGGGILEVAKDATLAAPLSGTSSLIKRGPGALTLTGVSTFTGATTVAAGPLLINGRLPSAVTVAKDATIGGSGRIAALTVDTGGSVSPGGSDAAAIGTLTVDGNVVLANGSTYQVDIGDQGKSDLLAVGGTATLGGAALALNSPGASGSVQQTEYTILTAAGGVNGRFGAIASEALPFLTPSLTYAPRAVTLSLARNNVAFSSVATSPDQAAVASAIEAGGVATALYGTVTRLSRAAAPRSFEALAGTSHASTPGVLVDQAQKIGQLVLGRLRQADLAEQSFYESEASGASPHSGLTAWGQALGSWTNPRGGDANSGFSRRQIGFITGLDAPLGTGWRVGAAYSHSWTNLNFDNGSLGRINSDTLAVYGGGVVGPLHVRLGGAHTWHQVRSERHLRIPGLSSDLVTKYSARSTQLFGEASAPIYLGLATVEPFAGLSYVRLKSKAFTETGGAAALRGADDKRTVTYSTLGLRTSFGLGTVTPYASAAWQHAFGDWNPSRPLTFADSGRSFLVRGVPLARNSVALEAGVQANLPRGTLSISYVGNISKRWKDNGVKLGFAYAF